jgi:hypothetical protein
MFSSFFNQPANPKATNFHPVTLGLKPEDYFGELEPKDLELTCSTGFVTETQTWYHFLEDGTFLSIQLIHSGVGMWYPTIQMTCKIYNPATKDKHWTSVNVADFQCPGDPRLDKRSSKSDKFIIQYKTTKDPEYPEAYDIRANLTDKLQFSVTISRLGTASGWKVGKGPKGGFSYFGPDLSKPEGYTIHRFWPRTKCSGTVIREGNAIEANGIGMFVHAIQGMRPNLVATKWNFVNFQSNELGGVSGIQMDYTTTSDYGQQGAGSGGVTISVGSLVARGKLIAVTAEVVLPGEKPSEDPSGQSHAQHLDHHPDKETGYKPPSRFVFTWGGPSVVEGVKGNVSATLELNSGTPQQFNGLIEKVDVLAEIPYVIKSLVNYVAGTKPYIYQFYNPATLTLTGPASVIGDGEGEGTTTVAVNGTLFNEATFIS